LRRPHLATRETGERYDLFEQRSDKCKNVKAHAHPYDEFSLSDLAQMYPPEKYLGQLSKGRVAPLGRGIEMYYFPNIDERTGVEFIYSGIQAHNEPVQHDGFVVYESVTLEDHSVLRKVRVDSAIDPLFRRSMVDPNAIYVVKKLFDGWVVYAIETEGQLSIGGLNSFVRGRFVAAILITLLAALVPVASTAGGEIGMTLMSAVALLSLLSAIHFKQLGELLRSASMLRQSRSLDIY
jgi:hypothetical protein